MAEHRRGPWSQFEDEVLIRLVQQQGPLNWVRISDTLVSRSPKQCRERYHQNLKPTLNHEPISAEEGQLIEKLVGDLGKRWAEIARRLNNRSDNAVKNWWNGSQNRRKRTIRKKSAGGNNAHRRLTAPLGHPRRPQLELATGAAHIFQANHRHEPVSPCMVHYGHTMQNAPSSSGLPSPHSDRSSLYSASITKDALPPGSPIALPPLRRNSYDAMKPTLRPEPLLPPVSGGPNFRLPPIQTLDVGEHHALPTAPNSPSDSGPLPIKQEFSIKREVSIKQEYDLFHSFPGPPFGPINSRRGSQNDDGDARLRVSHLVD
ncbi:hypothetical protein RRF57_002967 [Xylaria bambusicola]|uniref:Uncharacterized protein n=1 Tax=Xylaria bambusicola TaxID=326684 RepID=A0AAN7UFY8_9PEZI